MSESVKSVSQFIIIMIIVSNFSNSSEYFNDEKQTRKTK